MRISALSLLMIGQAAHGWKDDTGMEIPSEIIGVEFISLPQPYLWLALPQYLWLQCIGWRLVTTIQSLSLITGLEVFY